MLECNSGEKPYTNKRLALVALHSLVAIQCFPTHTSRERLLGYKIDAFDCSDLILFFRVRQACPHRAPVTDQHQTKCVRAKKKTAARAEGREHTGTHDKSRLASADRRGSS